MYMCLYIIYLSLFHFWPAGAEAGFRPEESPCYCADVRGSPDGHQCRWPVPVWHHRPLLWLLSSICGHRRVESKPGHAQRTGCKLHHVRIISLYFFHSCFNVKPSKKTRWAQNVVANSWCQFSSYYLWMSMN